MWKSLTLKKKKRTLIDYLVTSRGTQKKKGGGRAEKGDSGCRGVGPGAVWLVR
jgi:hypothetical protein